MGLRRREPGQTKVQRRVSKIATPDLFLYIETHLSELSTSVRALRSAQSSDTLSDAAQTAEVLAALLAELKTRARLH